MSDQQTKDGGEWIEEQVSSIADELGIHLDGTPEWAMVDALNLKMAVEVAGRRKILRLWHPNIDDIQGGSNQATREVRERLHTQIREFLEGFAPPEHRGRSGGWPVTIRPEHVSDIFLSYARDDLARVKPLVDALEAHGWSVWWDPRVTPGQTWDHVIQAALGAARCVVVIWSNASVKSEWVRIEAYEGKRRDILIPALIDDVTAGIPLAFRLTQAANLAGWSGKLPHAGFNDLARAVEGIFGTAGRAARQCLRSDSAGIGGDTACGGVAGSTLVAMGINSALSGDAQVNANQLT
jgi:hypothetical protein